MEKQKRKNSEDKPITLGEFLFQWIWLQIFGAIVAVLAIWIIISETRMTDGTSITIALIGGPLTIMLFMSLAQYNPIKHLLNLNFRTWFIANGISAFVMLLCFYFNSMNGLDFGTDTPLIGTMFALAVWAVSFPLGQTIVVWMKQPKPSAIRLLTYLVFSVLAFVSPIFYLNSDAQSIYPLFPILLSLLSIQGLIMWWVLNSSHRTAHIVRS